MILYFCLNFGRSDGECSRNGGRKRRRVQPERKRRRVQAGRGTEATASAGGTQNEVDGECSRNEKRG